MADSGWFNEKTRRKLQLTIYVTMIVLAVTLVLVFSAAVALGGRFSLSDRLAMLNDVFAGCAVLLAVIAGAIALQAHAAATGTPSVEMQVWLGSSKRNELTILSVVQPNGWRRSIGVAGQSVLHIRLRNKSKFDAQNIRLLVTFCGIAFSRTFDGRHDGWRIIDSVEEAGSTMTDWVSDSWLYADSTVRVPGLDLESLIELKTLASPCLKVRVLTHDHQRTIELPITFTTPKSATNLHENLRAEPEWL